MQLVISRITSGRKSLRVGIRHNTAKVVRRASPFLDPLPVLLDLPGTSGAPQRRRQETRRVLLRRAVSGDERAVAAVRCGSWQVAYRGLLPSALLDGLDPAERAKRYSFATDGPDRGLPHHDAL